MLSRLFFVLALSSIFSVNTTVAQNCTENQAGKCFKVHGRYAIYVENNGIWVMGTNRLLSTGGDERLDDMINDKGDWEKYAIVGDFVVCPLTKYKRGHMQTVCIKSYANLKIVKRR